MPNNKNDYKTFTEPLRQTSVEVAKQWLTTSIEDGAYCPCCGQLVKLYRRKLYASMAMVLTLIYREFKRNPEMQWLHVPTFLNGRGVLARGGDWAKLVYWGVIEARTRTRDNQDAAVGYYCITDKGRDFVEVRTSLPAAVYVYDGHVQRFDEERTTIVQALGKSFDYDELMRGS
jgi:hypothetical protein